LKSYSALKFVRFFLDHPVYCVGPGGTHSNIDKPNKRKIHTNTLFHLGFVEIISLPHEGVIRGVFPANHLVSTDN